MVVQALKEIVYGDVGVRADEDRKGDLPMEFEKLDRLDDDTGLAL